MNASLPGDDSLPPGATQWEQNMLDQRAEQSEADRIEEFYYKQDLKYEHHKSRGKED